MMTMASRKMELNQPKVTQRSKKFPHHLEVLMKKPLTRKHHPLLMRNQLNSRPLKKVKRELRNKKNQLSQIVALPLSSTKVAAQRTNGSSKTTVSSSSNKKATKLKTSKNKIKQLSNRPLHQPLQRSKRLVNQRQQEIKLWLNLSKSWLPR